MQFKKNHILVLILNIDNERRMRLAKQGGCFVDIACMSESLTLYSIGSQCNCLKQ